MTFFCNNSGMLFTLVVVLGLVSNACERPAKQTEAAAGHPGNAANPESQLARSGNPASLLPGQITGSCIGSDGFVCMALTDALVGSPESACWTVTRSSYQPGRTCSQESVALCLGIIPAGTYLSFSGDLSARRVEAERICANLKGYFSISQ